MRNIRQKGTKGTMSPCHSSFEQLNINLLRVMHSGFVSVTVHSRSFKMQQLWAPPSEMSSQDTQTVAPYIQWAPSQLGKVHCTAEEGSIIISDPNRIIFFCLGCVPSDSPAVRVTAVRHLKIKTCWTCASTFVSQGGWKWNACTLRNSPKMVWFGGEAVYLLLFQMFLEDYYCLTGYLCEQYILHLIFGIRLFFVELCTCNTEKMKSGLLVLQMWQARQSPVFSTGRATPQCAQFHFLLPLWIYETSEAKL